MVDERPAFVFVVAICKQQSRARACNLAAHFHSQLTEETEQHRFGAFRVILRYRLLLFHVVADLMCDRQFSIKLDVADHLAAARSNEIEAAATACAALLQRSHLQLVAIVDVSPLRFRRFALANVANGVNLFA